MEHFCPSYETAISPSYETPGGSNHTCSIEEARNFTLMLDILIIYLPEVWLKSHHSNLSYGQKTKICSRPGKLSKVHVSGNFQGKVHLNFCLSGSPTSPYIHPKKQPIPPKVYLLNAFQTMQWTRGYEGDICVKAKFILNNSNQLILWEMHFKPCMGLERF